MRKQSPRSEDPIQAVIDSIILASDLDALHLSLSQLSHLLQEGELELFLEQPNKSHAQKEAYLSKVIETVTSHPLRQELAKQLASSNLEFFSASTLGDFLATLRTKAEKVEIVRLTVAIAFKPADLTKMVTLLAEQLGQPVALDVSVDHSLIGGVIIQYGARVWDSSLKSRLTTFRANWERAVASTTK